jgi:hypothetical protein
MDEEISAAQVLAEKILEACAGNSIETTKEALLRARDYMIRIESSINSQ